MRGWPPVHTLSYWRVGSHQWMDGRYGEGEVRWVAIDTRANLESYEVGGVRLGRPFKVQRLGHLGLNLSNMEAGRHFYQDLLGHFVSDPRDMTAHLDPSTRDSISQADRVGYFMRYGSDHHSLVLAPTAVERARGRMQPGSEITINQLSWQVGSLRETVDCIGWLQDEGCEIYKTGRDMPGSNWHTYTRDPEGHVNELFYGMEQIGWEGLAKPHAMHYRGFTDSPELPQPCEGAEVDEAIAKGIDFLAGYRSKEPLDRPFDVGGVLLARPFRIVAHGPVRLFVDDVETARHFYEHTLGFMPTEPATWRGYEGLVLRCSNLHHAVGLYPKELRGELGLSSHSTLMSFGMRVANYQQLRNAVTFLRAEGVEFIDIPQELTPGIDYAAYAFDPDGHAIELYCAMDQLGWDYRPRPVASRVQRPKSLDEWPEVVDDATMTVQEPFLGPLG